ncbi:MAG: tRNA (adenosine(37)-N6)-threonylcarbamoyltransferase complex ATPase subunit type 1 TsaE [Chthoniobacteraceae bacterium]
MASTILLNAEATVAFGREFAANVAAGDVLALCGDLGAGKTHFVKGLAAGLGAITEATSPTFTLIHEYRDGRLPLFHFDLYRLETEDELLRIGFDEYLDEAGVLAIEWADKFPALMPPQTRWLRFSHRPDGSRAVEVT